MVYIHSSQYRLYTCRLRPPRQASARSVLSNFGCMCCYVEFYTRKILNAPTNHPIVLKTDRQCVEASINSTRFWSSKKGGATPSPAEIRAQPRYTLCTFDHSETHRSVVLSRESYFRIDSNQTHSNNLTQRTWWIGIDHPFIFIDSITLLTTLTSTSWQNNLIISILIQEWEMIKNQPRKRLLLYR